MRQVYFVSQIGSLETEGKQAIRLKVKNSL